MLNMEKLDFYSDILLFSSILHTLPLDNATIVIDLGTLFIFYIKVAYNHNRMKHIIWESLPMSTDLLIHV
jgi:hypothetical protein